MLSITSQDGMPMQHAEKGRVIRNFSGKHPEARDRLKELDSEKKIMSKLTYLKQNGWEAIDLIPLAQHQDQWRGLGSGKVEGFLTCWESFSLSQRILPHGTMRDCVRDCVRE
jgi:hypothetical protein